MLEELLAKGHSGAEYDAWLINIGDGSQFGAGFVTANPNSKIPALMDHSEETPLRVFESGSILLYLADKVWGVHPKGSCGKNRMPELVILADGRNTDVGWWFWSLRLRTSKDRIRD